MARKMMVDAFGKRGALKGGAAPDFKYLDIMHRLLNEQLENHDARLFWSEIQPGGIKKGMRLKLTDGLGVEHEVDVGWATGTEGRVKFAAIFPDGRRQMLEAVGKGTAANFYAEGKREAQTHPAVAIEAARLWQQNIDPIKWAEGADSKARDIEGRLAKFFLYFGQPATQAALAMCLRCENPYDFYHELVAFLGNGAHYPQPARGGRELVSLFVLQSEFNSLEALGFDDRHAARTMVQRMRAGSNLAREIGAWEAGMKEIDWGGDYRLEAAVLAKKSLKPSLPFTRIKAELDKKVESALIGNGKRPASRQDIGEIISRIVMDSVWDSVANAPGGIES